MRNFEKLFEEFDKGDRPSGIVLLSIDSPLRIYYGIGGHGGYRIAFLASGQIPEFKSTRAIRVSVVEESSDTHWVYFDLIDPIARAVYLTFCDDLVQVLEGHNDLSEEDALQLLRNRYMAWMLMFRQDRSALSEEQVIGLLGELYFIKTYMIPKFGAAQAIAGWSGVDGLNKDFAVEDKWYEVKMLSLNANSVRISSLAQLSSPKPGALTVIRYETMSASYDDPTCSVMKLFKAILKDLVDDEVRADFISKIISFGFDITGGDTEHKYRIASLTFYRVDDAFPRIQTTDVTRPEIDKVSYSLIVNTLDKFKFDGRL